MPQFNKHLAFFYHLLIRYPLLISLISIFYFLFVRTTFAYCTNPDPILNPELVTKLISDTYILTNDDERLIKILATSYKHDLYNIIADLKQDSLNIRNQTIFKNKIMESLTILFNTKNHFILNELIFQTILADFQEAASHAPNDSSKILYAIIGTAIWVSFLTAKHNYAPEMQDSLFRSYLPKLFNLTLYETIKITCQ